MERKRGNSRWSVRKGLACHPVPSQQAAMVSRWSVRRGLSSKPASSDGVLIPELPSEVALDILVRLPRLVQARLRLVCRAWRDAMEPAAMSSLRKMRHISEVWPVKLSDNFKLLVTMVDPLLHRTHQLSLPPQILRHSRSYESVVLNVIGHEILMAVMPHPCLPVDFPLELQGLYCFDAACMKWKDIKFSSLPPSLRGIRRVPSRAVHKSMSVAFSGDESPQLFFFWGGYDDWQYSAERLDLKTKMWEPLPHPNVKRRRAAGVMLQGLFYMIGGVECTETYSFEFSGEIWDPVSGKWTLVPELWPFKVFGLSYAVPRVAVVMDRLYALRSASGSEELMYYETSSKVWMSLGYIPGFHDDDYMNLFGKDQELWLLRDGVFLVTQPSLSRPLSWRALADCSKSPLCEKWIGALLI